MCVDVLAFFFNTTSGAGTYVGAPGSKQNTKSITRYIFGACRLETGLLVVDVLSSVFLDKTSNAGRSESNTWKETKHKNKNALFRGVHIKTFFYWFTEMFF